MFSCCASRWELRQRSGLLLLRPQHAWGKRRRSPNAAKKQQHGRHDRSQHQQLPQQYMHSSELQQQPTSASCSPVLVAENNASSTATAVGNDSNGSSRGCELHAAVAAAAIIDKNDDAVTAAGALLMELSHLPCFLLMEFVAGPKLKDSGAALMGRSNSWFHFLSLVCSKPHIAANHQLSCFLMQDASLTFAILHYLYPPR